MVRSRNRATRRQGRASGHREGSGTGGETPWIASICAEEAESMENAARTRLERQGRDESRDCVDLGVGSGHGWRGWGRGDSMDCGESMDCRSGRRIRRRDSRTRGARRSGGRRRGAAGARREARKRGWRGCEHGRQRQNVRHGRLWMPTLRT
jgi:hypothetical protein